MVQFDEFGPEKILEVHDHKTGMHGFVVIDNTTLGPAKGGIRMTPSVTIDEVAKLARTMTWKNSVAGLPFGGGKAGIIADDRKLTKEQKLGIIGSFAKAIKAVCPKYYVAGPDMNTGEEEMKAFVEGNGNFRSATGKPANLCEYPGERCGIPHEFGSTGFGVFHSIMVACKFAKIKPGGASVAIEGFGNVGTFAMKHLTEKGFKVVGVSDSGGCIYNPEGLDYSRLMEVKQREGTVAKYQPGEVLPSGKVFELPVDILVPAAIPNSINEGNIDNVKARLIAEAANIPMTPEIEQKLHEKGVLVIPDFVANAGGVISSYAEYRGKNPQDMFYLVEKKIVRNTRKILRHARKAGVKPRDAAMEMAIARVRKAMAKKAAKPAAAAPAAETKPENQEPV
ncbi:MAG: Glu/Leu/Phe/Val dehydrogenase [Candidatus Aenigmarchaeota archaeon]|nr:Glu/Leu/Phe/Val dehydrogenase [Candidatus Aenigmarchaeota archaeon]